MNMESEAPKRSTRIVHDLAPPPNSTITIQSATKMKPNDDFYATWDRFLSKSPSTRNPSSSALAKRVAQTERAAHKNLNGLRVHEENSAKSYEQAKANCKAKVRAIVSECRRLNQKYIDRHFDLENHEDDCIFPLGNSNYDDDNARPSAVKRIEDIFEKPQFNEDRACAADVIQGQLGDCWLLAALMSLAAKPGLIKRLCVDRDEQVGVYGFVFFRDGAWVPEVIDDRLFLHVSDGEDLFVGKLVDASRTRAEVSTTSYDINKLRENLQKGGEALFFARCKENSDTWLPLIEKAYAKAHGDYGSIEGGDTSEGIEDLTGGVSVSLKPSQILDKNLFWEEMKNANDTYLFAGGAKHYEPGGRSGQYAYAVLQVVEHNDLKLLKLRDPWGRHQDDGPWMHKFTEWSAELVEQIGYNFKDPGVFWMTYENFLRHFYIIDRTRLFGADWKVTQQWATVTVPPIPEYLETQFSLTLTEAGPVVLVLCQPDTRYFCGLEGRYEYSLHFRVYSEGDRGTYLTRSMHGSGCLPRGLRSVTADLELDAGTYSILLKVTPERLTSRVASGQVIETYSRRKEKLLQAGRNFDLAHAKGKRRDKEVENKRRAKEEERLKRREELVKARKIRQEGKSREKRRKERIENERVRRKDAAFWRETAERAARKGVVVPPGLPSPDLTTAAAWDDADVADDYFEWDSDIDGTADDIESEGDEKDLYADDPWNAICVLGLRVYSQNGDAEIRVVEGGLQLAEENGKESDKEDSDKSDGGEIESAKSDGESEKGEKDESTTVEEDERTMINSEAEKKDNGPGAEKCKEKRPDDKLTEPHETLNMRSKSKTNTSTGVGGDDRGTHVTDSANEHPSKASIPKQVEDHQATMNGKQGTERLGDGSGAGFETDEDKD